MTRRLEAGFARRFRSLLALVRPKRLEFGVALLLGRARERAAREGRPLAEALAAVYLFTRQRVARRLEVTGACTLPEAPWSKLGAATPAFLCDESLGGLARWLRAGGYEARTAPMPVLPGALATLARPPRARRAAGRGGGRRPRPAHERGRAARPASGARRARPHPLGAHRPRAHHPARAWSWPTWASALREPRCMACGGELEAQAKEAVAERIPPRTARWKDDYWTCRSCGHLFWQGTHWERIARALEAGGGGVKAKALAQNLGLAAVTSLLFLGGLELVARSFDEPAPAAAPVADYIWDWREKMEGDFYVIRSEAVGWPPWEEINADGLRDRTHPVEKPPGRYRLVALGDSVTLGAGIQPEEAYPQQLEAALCARRAACVDVMNVGLWGWSTRQERLAYERIVRRYRPDHVLLGVCLNDLPELQNNLARPPDWLAALFRGSALVRRVVNAPGREIQSVEQLFTDREAPRVREAYARFFAEVGALRDEVRKDGAAFGLVVFPVPIPGGAGGPGARGPAGDRGLLPSRGHRRSSTCCPRSSPLGEAGFVDYDHLSAAGAARVAEAIAASDLLPRSPSQREVLAARFGRPAPRSTARWWRPSATSDEAVRAAAAWALEQRRRASERPALARPSARRWATRAPRSAPARRAPWGPWARRRAAATPDLFERLRDDVQDVRWQAALALSRIGLAAPAAVEPLARALRSDDPYVRGFAAWSLGNLGPAASAAVPALVEALAKDDGYGRGGAAAALARMGPAAAAAVPALLEGLQSPDGDRRWKAARTLGRIGPAAREAMPALAQALRDPERARAPPRGPRPGRAWVRCRPKPPPACSAPPETPTPRSQGSKRARPSGALIATPPMPRDPARRTPPLQCASEDDGPPGPLRAPEPLLRLRPRERRRACASRAGSRATRGGRLDARSRTTRPSRAS